MGLQGYCPVPALDVRFQHWMSSSSTRQNKSSFFSPVPALGTPCWHGVGMGTSASQFQHGVKNQSQFQHWAGANMGSNIYKRCLGMKEEQQPLLPCPKFAVRFILWSCRWQMASGRGIFDQHFYTGSNM